MADQNRGVVYEGPGKVQVEDIPFPKLEWAYQGQHRDCQHGVILQVVSTNICGSDQHMVRGRTTAPVGMTVIVKDWTLFVSAVEGRTKIVSAGTPSQHHLGPAEPRQHRSRKRTYLRKRYQENRRFAFPLVLRLRLKAAVPIVWTT